MCKKSYTQEISKVIKASIGHRAKEKLIIEFINVTNLDEIQDKNSIIEIFFKFAKEKQQIEAYKIIKDENLNKQKTIRYLTLSLKRGYISENGSDLNEILPKMSPLNPKYLDKKRVVFEKLSEFVDKFKGIGGEIK